MGLQFMDIFKEWASEYDATVTGHDEQYREVFAGYETMLNEVLIAEGYAEEVTYTEGYAHAEDFRAAESRARDARAGLWGAC